MPKNPKTGQFFSAKDLRLGDDGTLDTIIELPWGEELRYNQKTAAEYRDGDGDIDLEMFIEEIVWPDVCMEY